MRSWKEAIMPRKLETHTHWEDSDHRLHEEKELPATEAKQGRMGRRVLAMLIVALALTAIVWALAEIWGGQTTQTAPVTATQDQTAPPKPPVQGNSQPQ
jgi:ferric-dicitrate binding protein FerR (iron transport regulator)